jgi:uncharacterized protein (DUF3084 family)
VSRALIVLALSLAASSGVVAAPAGQDAKSQVEAIQQRTADQGRQVGAMQERVRTLETQGKQADQALGERDRAIAELERQLREAGAAKTGGAPAAGSSGK